MANTYIKPTVIVKTALGLLQREIKLPALVWLNGIGDFAGAKDDTLSLRVPARTTSNKRTLRATGGGRAISYGSLTQTKVDVVLTSDIYNALPVTDEELTLDIESFGVDILQPQVRAVAEGLENELAALMQDTSYETTLIMDPADPYSSLVAARKALNDDDVPSASRCVAVGSGIEAAMLKADLFKRADQAGESSARAVQVEGYLGRVAGFDIVQSNALEPFEAYAFHKTAFVMATRAPVVPAGASAGAGASYQGLAMRWLRDYDFENTQDRSLVDAYLGLKAVTDDSVVIRALACMLKPTSIDVTPATSTKAAAATQQLTVTATFTDGDNSWTADVTAYSDFTSATPAKATVSSAGLVTAVATGSSVITASFAGRTDTMTQTVS